MLKLESQIQNYKLPLIIPKRNKGDNEVLGFISLKSKDLQDPEDFIQYIIPISKNVITPSTLEELTQKICDSLNIRNIVIDIAFQFHLDRTSPKYFLSSYELKCFYRTSVEDGLFKVFKGIELPVRVKNIIPLQGKLLFYIEEPKTLFFEDLLDHIQKFTGIKLYPKISFDETEDLKILIDDGKTSKEYLNVLSTSSSIKDLGKGGYVMVEESDIYFSYTVKRSILWENEDVRKIIKGHKSDIEWEEEFCDKLSKEIIGDLALSSGYYLDVLFIIKDEINEWKHFSETPQESIRNHGNLVYKMLKNKTKKRLRKEIADWSKVA